MIEDWNAFLVSFLIAAACVNFLGLISWFLFRRFRRKPAESAFNQEIDDIERPRDSAKSSLRSNADAQHSVEHAFSQKSAPKLTLSKTLTLRSVLAEDYEDADDPENNESENPPGEVDAGARHHQFAEQEVPLAQILAEASSGQQHRQKELAEQNAGQAELPAESAARTFSLKVGHCPRGLRQDSQLVYVEPAALGLPLHLLIDDVKVHQRGMNPVSCSRNNYIETAGGRFECWTSVPNLEPSFKVVVTWKQGLRMTPVSQVVTPCTVKPLSAEIMLPVKVPETYDFATVSLRKDLQHFYRCLEQHEAQQESFQTSRHRRVNSGLRTE